MIELYVGPSSEIKELAARTSLMGIVSKKLGDLSPTERMLVDKWIDENQPAWEEFVAGSRKRYCWVNYSSLNEGDEWILTMRHHLSRGCISWGYMAFGVHE